MDRNNEIVSVVLPCYNSELTIKKCIESILLQTYRSIEIIVVDDGSTDNSAQIIKEIIKKDKRIKYFYKKNEGVSSARNLAISKSEGTYIAYIDADDTFEPDFIKLMVEKIKSQNVDMVFCGYSIVSKDYKAVVRDYSDNELMLNSRELRNELITRLLKFGGKRLDAYIWKTLAKSSLVKKLENPFDVDIHMLEDFTYMLRLLIISEKIAIVDAPLYNYFVSQNSATGKYMSSMENSIIKVNQISRNLLNSQILNIDNNIIHSQITQSFFILASNVCKKESPFNIFEKNKQIKQIYNTHNIQESLEIVIKNCLKEVSISKKVMLFLFKYRLFYPYILLVSIKHNR